MKIMRESAKERNKQKERKIENEKKGIVYFAFACFFRKKARLLISLLHATHFYDK